MIRKTKFRSCTFLCKWHSRGQVRNSPYQNGIEVAVYVSVNDHISLQLPFTTISITPPINSLPPDWCMKMFWIIILNYILYKHIDGLMQERCNSIAFAMGLRLSCMNLSIFCEISVKFCEIFCANWQQPWYVDHNICHHMALQGGNELMHHNFRAFCWS